MALVTVTYDTVEKTMQAAIDGTPVENVYEAYFMASYGEQGEFHCALTTRLEDKDNDTLTYTRMMAAEAAGSDAKRAAASESFAGFVEVAEEADPLSREAAEYFGVGA
jgi:hypothetical protein